MSAQVADAGNTDVPPPPYEPLPAVTKDLFVVHYSFDPHAVRQNRMPAVSAIVVQSLFSGTPLAFAPFTEAEACGIPPAKFQERFQEFEREMFRDFAEYTATHSAALWVHWGMREAFFGFDALTLRAKFHRQKYHNITPERRFDLERYLARRFGDFAPHPRLWNAARRNLGTISDFLNEKATADAWEHGQYGAELRSLYAKVDAIARLFEQVRSGQFQTGTAEIDPPPALKPAAPPRTRPDDPAFFSRPGIPTGTPSFSFDQMTLRHWEILRELFRREAFTHKSRVKTAALAVGVAGPDANPNSFKRPIAELAEFELVGTSEGQGGGVWLTRDGRLLAQSRSGD